MVNNKRGVTSTKFEMGDLPQEIAKVVDTLKVQQISEPFIMRDPKTEREVVVIVKLTNRIAGHKANMKDDYQTIKSLYEEKTKSYSKEKWNILAGEMNDIFAEFAACMKSGEKPDSAKAQNLVKMLQDHITQNYYLCTDEILAGLGQMYTQDERFKNNIDKNADGTAVFVCGAIEFYCYK